MTQQVEFETTLHTLDDLISAIKTLPAYVVSLRIGDRVVRKLLDDAGQGNAYLNAEILAYGRQLTFRDGYAHIERAEPSYTLAKPIQGLAE